jgi:hypothetical protein
VLLATDDQAGAEAGYREAIAIAQQQSAKLRELRAATSLALLWREQGKPIEEWLQTLGLPQYGPAFIAADINPLVLPDLTEADLERLGRWRRPCGPRARLRGESQ